MIILHPLTSKEEGGGGGGRQVENEQGVGGPVDERFGHGRCARCEEPVRPTRRQACHTRKRTTNDSFIQSLTLFPWRCSLLRAKGRGHGGRLCPAYQAMYTGMSTRNNRAYRHASPYCPRQSPACCNATAFR